MKKKISRIWGIGLVVVLAASLLLSAAPVSAGTLSFGSVDLPDEAGKNLVLTSGDNIVDLAVSGDGSVIYALVTTGNQTYRSTNGGESWSRATIVDNSVVLVANKIAVAQDDPNYLAVSAADATVYITDDAGANWDTLGQVAALNGNVSDLAISVEKSGRHFVAMIGENAGVAEVWYYEIGAIGSVWTQATGLGAYDAGGAIAFSPNFYSDQALVAVAADLGTTTIDFCVYSFNTNTWNSGAFNDFPADLDQDSEVINTLESASIAMAPDYLGSDDAMRVAFVGLAVNNSSTPKTSGIFRLDNDSVTVLREKKAIASVAFDGSLLVAGRYDNAGVYRSTDPLADDPSTSGSESTKNPGSSSATPMVQVGIAGSTVVAGTSGAESAFAYSEDNGRTFNDLSLIDTTLATLSDVAVMPDGSMYYIVTSDGGIAMSVWAYGDRWERIYSNASADDDYILRMAPDDPDIMYLADVGGTNIYFTSSAGTDKWFTRIYRESTGVVDMAVEGDGDVVYVLTTAGYVSKSSNRGFVWDSKKSSKLSGGSSMIASLGEDMIIAGSSDGYVAYSTDGNATWTKLDDDMGGAVQVTATGLSDGDIVLAGDSTSGEFYRWELGDDDEWDSILVLPTDYDAVTGVGIFQGVLYVISANTTSNTDSKMMRTLTPTSDDPTWSTVDSAGELFDVIPTALRGSVSGTSTKIWAIDTVGANLFSYTDSLAVASVAARAPADGADIAMNTVSGDSSQVIFSWTSPSDKVTEFNFEIATDSGFNEDVLNLTITKSSGTWDKDDIISQIVGPGASGNANIQFQPDTTYYWRVRVSASGPVRSAYSTTRSFTMGSLPEVQPPVVIEQAPPPVISVPPAPAITLQPPEIVLPAPTPVPDIVIPAAPEPTPPVPTWAIYAIIIIGAVLVIALIVLIMRTRRPV